MPEPTAASSQCLVKIVPEQSGDRLDRALAARLPDLSRSRLKSLIEDGHARLERGDPKAPRTIIDPAFRVKHGQEFMVQIPEATPAIPEAQAIALNVVYEDSDIIIVDKPAGMVVHPAPGNADRTLVNALIAHCGKSLSGIGGVRRPGIVHRIDKETSGLLVAAKNDIAHQKLSQAFQRHDIERAYLCVVWGCPVPSSGEIRGNIGRHPKLRKRMTVLNSGGKNAVTKYRVLERYGSALALLECQLETGRTHQIRVHLSSIGHPIVGDSVYGKNRRHQISDSNRAGRAAKFPRQALHAAVLGFRHPRTGKTMRWESAPPSDMQELLHKIK